jgi:hypothetical protein
MSCRPASNGPRRPALVEEEPARRVDRGKETGGSHGGGGGAIAVLRRVREGGEGFLLSFFLLFPIFSGHARAGGKEHNEPPAD